LKAITTVGTNERPGILTQPVWLVADSDPVDNHAISRGRWIRKRLLGDAVPDSASWSPENLLYSPKLTRWRAGQTAEVQLKLRVMGTYAATAPYDCPKSNAIFDEACKVLEKEPLRSCSMMRYINAPEHDSPKNPHF